MRNLRSKQFKSCRELKTGPNLLDLPNEILYDIISRLKKDVVLKASRVCKRLNGISLLPSLWKKEDVFIKSRNQMMSFCKFFQKTSNLRRLSLMRKLEKRTNLEKEAKLVGNLFKTSENIICLNTNFPLSIEIIPSSLKHLSFAAYPKATELIPFHVSENIQPILLQYLGLTLLGQENYHNYDEIVIKLIDNCNFSLKSINLHYNTISENILTSISNCHSLKEITLHRFDNKHSTSDFNLMVALSNLPELEMLSVSGMQFMEPIMYLQIGGFQKLKYLRLSITHCKEIVDFAVMLIGFRNLNSLLLDFKQENFSFAKLYVCIRSFVFYKNLINVGIGCTEPVDDLRYFEQILMLHLDRKFKSFCICKLFGPSNENSSIVKLIKQNMTCSLCLLKPNNYCNCPCED